MLAMTPDVESALRWFTATHDMQVDGLSGLVRWTRTALPRAGGIGDQRARLMEALAYIRDVYHDAVRKPVKGEHAHG